MPGGMGLSATAAAAWRVAWLPAQLPPGVMVVVSAEQGSGVGDAIRSRLTRGLREVKPDSGRSNDMSRSFIEANEQ